MDKKDKKKKNVDEMILGANSEMLSRYSSAGKEIKVALDGIDRETGKKLHRGLEDIARSKINPDYENVNLNQQAGFSAEILDTARQNAENIKKGSHERVTRTDDIDGRVNDIQSDQVTLDKYGNVIQGSEVQMKFLKDADAFVKRISTKNYEEHYPDGNFRVPSDQYDKIKDEIQKKIKILEGQQLTAEKQKQLEYLRKVNKNLKKSTVSKSEAIQTRKDPKKVVAKEIAKTSHQAGIQAAKTGAIIGGGSSLISNIDAVLSGEKEPDEALVDTLKDTGLAAGESYAIAFVNTTLASVLKNHGNSLLRSLGKTNAPAMIIQTAKTTVQSLIRLSKGTITLNEFYLEIGKNGSTLVTASVGGTAGGAIGFAFGGPVGAAIGATIGSIVSSLVWSVFYDYTIGMKILSKEIDEFIANTFQNKTQQLQPGF
ncbi:MAG: hypothetical protein LBV67_06560 [Streptococcaceae bacterium]|jgi:hypothetical protein|nr:hypothetical protein [Streptococcaceae bacterium]